MRLIAGVVVSVLMAILGGCAGVSNKIELTQSHMKLLTGEAIFGEPVQVSESTALDPLHINDEMRIFVGDIASAKPETARYRKLITKLERNGYYDESYDPTLTSSASETFASKKGNCLSYTNMFVALARIANLDAQYQLVHMRFPSWDVQGRLLIRNNHINRIEAQALVARFDGEFPDRYFEEVLNYLEIDKEKFFKLSDEFRSPHLWKKINGKWMLRHNVNNDGFND